MLLAGCTEKVPYGGQGSVVSETPAAANGVLTCRSLVAERDAVGQTLQLLADDKTAADQIARLQQRQAALVELVASKRCPGG